MERRANHSGLVMYYDVLKTKVVQRLNRETRFFVAAQYFRLRNYFEGQAPK